MPGPPGPPDDPHPPPGPPGASGGEEFEEDSGVRYVQVAAVIGGVVLVVLVAVAVAVTSGGGENTGPASAATSTRTTLPPAQASPGPAVPVTPSSAPAVPSGVPSSPGGTPPPAAGPRVVWRGTLTVNGPRARRDLDVVPPRTSTRGGEPDVRGDWLATPLKGESDAQLALLKPGARPEARECRDAALATGESETEPLHTGDVVCVVTAAGRVARLITTRAAQTSTAPVLTFTVVMWDLPAGG